MEQGFKMDANSNNTIQFQNNNLSATYGLTRIPESNIANDCENIVEYPLNFMYTDSIHQNGNHVLNASSDAPKYEKNESCTWNGMLESKANRGTLNVLNGMTPFNTPSTPFSLKQFMTIRSRETMEAKHGNHGIHSISSTMLQTITKVLVVVISPILLFRILNRHSVGEFLTFIIPDDINETWPSLHDIKPTFALSLSILVFLPFYLIFVPITLFLFMITFPFWFSGCVIYFFFKYEKQNPLMK